MEARPFRISDLVRMSGYSRDYIRRLENDGLIRRPVRTRGRQRRYSESEMQEILRKLSPDRIPA